MWSKDDLPLNITSILFSSPFAITALLFLDGLELSDTGLYSCTTSNSLPSTPHLNNTHTQSLTLTVLSQ